MTNTMLRIEGLAIEDLERAIEKANYIIKRSGDIEAVMEAKGFRSAITQVKHKFIEEKED